MKTNIFAILLLQLMISKHYGQNHQIIFQDIPFNKARELCLLENKLIFIAVSTSWCRPCKEMENTVFRIDSIADYFNSKFINIKIDLEFGEGMILDSLYSINSLPAYLFIDSSGKMQHRTGGRMASTEFLSEAITANLFDKNLAYYKSIFSANKNDKVFLLKYIDVLKKSKLLTTSDANEVLAIYFSKVNPEELLEQVNWSIFPSNASSFKSIHYKYLIANKQKFDSLYSKEVVDEKITNIISDTLDKISLQEIVDKEKYEIVKAQALLSNLNVIKKAVFNADMNLLYDKDWNTFQKLCIQKVDTLFYNDAGYLDYYALTFHNKIKDKKSLLIAEKWAKRSTSLDPEFANSATYALLLYKNGKYQLAELIAKKAIEYAKNENLEKEDFKSMNVIIDNCKTRLYIKN